jgi:hypothetical protein
MELIQIIYDILIYGGCLLFFVVVVSYFMSKIKKDNDYGLLPKTVLPKQTNQNNESLSGEQRMMRQSNTSSYPQIFVLNQIKPKEVKMVRTQTLEKRDIQVKNRFEENHSNRTNGNGKRYKIVNDEMHKSRFNVANFYL